MSDPQQPGPDPEPPRPPGAPDLDLDIPVGDVPGGTGERPDEEDVTEDGETPEPPD